MLNLVLAASDRCPSPFRRWPRPKTGVNATTRTIQRAACLRPIPPAEPRLRWRYGEGQIDSPNDTHYFYFYQAYGEKDGEGFSIVGSVLVQDDGVLMGGQRYRLEGHPRIGANEARAQISDWSASAGPINPSVDPMEFPEVLAFVEQWTSLSYCDATFRTLEEAKDWCEWINRLHTAASVPSEGPDQEARATSRWRTKAVRRLLYAGGGIVFLLILLASRWL